MKITIQTAGVTPHEPLKERIEKKLAKLETFYDKIVETTVYLKVENASEKSNKTIELLIKVPGDDIVVKKTSASFVVKSGVGGLFWSTTRCVCANQSRSSR